MRNKHFCESPNQNEDPRAASIHDPVTVPRCASISFIPFDDQIQPTQCFTTILQQCKLCNYFRG